MSEYYIGSAMINPYSLQHYGIKGQKWGRRNYQNPDGSYTAAGRLRYGIGQKVANGMQRAYEHSLPGRFAIDTENAISGSKKKRAQGRKGLMKDTARLAGRGIAVTGATKAYANRARIASDAKYAAKSAGKYWARSRFNPRRNVFDTTATEHVFSNAKRLAGGAVKSIGHVSAKQLTTGNYAVVTHAGKQSISRMLPALRNDLPALRNSSNGRAVLAIGAAATAAVVTGATVYAVHRHNQNKNKASKANKK